MRSFLHGAVQLHVLHHAAERPIHGAWMAAELARHGYRISPGTLYPTLHRLEAAGQLAGHDDLEAGRRIRRYTITDAGHTALAEAQQDITLAATRPTAAATSGRPADAGPTSPARSTTDHLRHPLDRVLPSLLGPACRAAGG